MAARKRNNTTETTPVNEENTTVSTETNPFDAPEVTDVDVDAPEIEAVDAPEDVVDAPTETAEKQAKEKKEPARPPVPEGKVSPVAFAKLLTAHLQENGRLEEGKVVAPQVVYSYIKNNGPESKNPFPAEKAEGRAAVVDAEAAIAWWDAKDERVKASKTAAAEKAAKKAAAPAKAEGETVAQVADAPELVEAE
jgi:hypothetical protein